MTQHRGGNVTENISSQVPAILNNSPLFEGLDEATLREISDLLIPVTYERGETIFSFGQSGDCLFMVTSGLIHIYGESETGREVLLAPIEPGNFFGELAILDGEPRSAKAIAKDATQVLRLDITSFHSFLTKYPSVATQVLKALSLRLRRTNVQLQDAIFLDIPGRVAKQLLALMEADSRRTSHGYIICTTLTQADIAQMLGVTRESVNKALSAFEKSGYLLYERGVITVLRPEQLKDRAK